MPFELFDPFNLSKNASPEKKANGLLVEINNGRLAMLGIMGFLAESKVEGAVPALTGIVKPYAGEVMAPFAATDAGLPCTPRRECSRPPRAAPRARVLPLLPRPCPCPVVAWSPGVVYCSRLPKWLPLAVDLCLSCRARRRRGHAQVLALLNASTPPTRYATRRALTVDARGMRMRVPS